MSNVNDAAPSRNRKRWWFVPLLVLVLLLIAKFGIGDAFRKVEPVKPLSASEQELIGKWRYQGGDPESELGYGYELHPDRTCTKQFYDCKTGELTGTNTDLIWWRDGDRLTVRLLYGARYTRWGLLHKSCPSDDIMTLTPDGPGQFKYQGMVDIEFYPSPQPSGSGTMTRVVEKSRSDSER